METAISADVIEVPVAAVPERVPHSHAAHHFIFPHLLDTIRSLLTVIIIAMFVLTFIVQPFRIPSESMERTLLVGDFLLVDKMIYAPGRVWSWMLPYAPVRRGDIVVFHFPLDPAEHLVKRVIGVPGDRIRLHNGTVYLNGKPQAESYAVYEGNYPDPFRDQFPAALYIDPDVDSHWWYKMRHDVQDGQLVVPANSYFVLGDNRNNSRDSRYWGFVPRENIVGSPLLVYFSLRTISGTDMTSLPGEKSTDDNSFLSALVDFARWDRTFHVVR